MEVGIVGQFGRKSTGAENIGEVEFPSGLQDAEDLRDDRRFVGAKVEHAVRDDDIDGIAFYAEGSEIFESPLAKVHVGFGVSEFLHLGGEISSGDLELLVREIDANDPTFWSCELRGQINIATRATAEIEHSATFEPDRDRRSAAVTPLDNLGIEAAIERLKPGGRCGVFAARRSFEVLTGSEHPPVVILRIGMVVEWLGAHKKLLFGIREECISDYSTSEPLQEDPAPAVHP
jgi:hypothetical protein